MVLKTKEQAKANLENSISYIPSRYAEGVRAADWATPAGSDQAEKNFASGISAAVAAKSRQAAIKKTPNTLWQTNAAELGGAVIGTRIAASLDKWATNWGPKYDRVSSVVRSLPPHVQDWRANINQRLVKTVAAWKGESA